MISTSRPTSDGPRCANEVAMSHSCSIDRSMGHQWLTTTCFPEAVEQINEIQGPLHDAKSPHNSNSQRSTNVSPNRAAYVPRLKEEEPVQSDSNREVTFDHIQHTPLMNYTVPENVPLIVGNEGPTNKALQNFMTIQKRIVNVEAEFMVDRAPACLLFALPIHSCICAIDKWHLPIVQIQERIGSWQPRVTLDCIIHAHVQLQVDDNILLLAANTLIDVFLRHLSHALT